MIQKAVFYLIFWIIHQVYTILEFFYDGYLYLSKKVVISNEVNSRNSLEKIPVHLTVLLGLEEPSCNDLCNLVIWSISTGISYISFYDYKGKLKKMENDFEKTLIKLKNEEDNVIFHNSEKSYKNGYIGRKIHVKIITEKDSRKSLANLCKNLCNTPQENINFKSNKIDIEFVNQKLEQMYQFPDPSIGIYFGKNFNTFGYPPWQIRVTEFYNIKSHHNLSFIDFKDVLQRYQKVEQRLGK